MKPPTFPFVMSFIINVLLLLVSHYESALYKRDMNYSDILHTQQNVQLKFILH